MLYYAALRRFDQDNGERWIGYTRWLGRTDLQRIVTLDNMICPAVVRTQSSDDWDFVAREDFMLDFFTDLDFVLRRAAAVSRAMVVAVARDPSDADLSGFPHPNFEFAGFDIVDAQFVASALFNANRFPGVFDVSELSAESGLIPARERAFEIRDTLRRRFPKREDARCFVWAIWRHTEATGDEDLSASAV